MKNFLILMIWSFLVPILVLSCGMDRQKSNFPLISDTLSIRGCWGQLMSLFWKLVDETQMAKPPEPTSHHNSRKDLILLPLRAIYFRSFYYETPCNWNTLKVISISRYKCISSRFWCYTTGFRQCNAGGWNGRPSSFPMWHQWMDKQWGRTNKWWLLWMKKWWKYFPRKLFWNKC